MMMKEELKARVPLIQEAHLGTLQRMEEHINAPKWNYYCGDRLEKTDLPFLEDFRQKTFEHRKFMTQPETWVIDYVKDIKNKSWFYESKLKFYNLENFYSLPVTKRSDFANSLSLILPHEEDLSRLVINPTSGTTGHKILCPNHPRAIGCYNPLILYALNQHEVSPILEPELILAMQLYSQKETAVYCTVKPILNGVGFAKLNINPNAWSSSDDSHKFIEDLKPFFFSGNPVGFKDYLDQGFTYKPAAFLSTSLELSPALRKELESKYHAKVIDFYSLNDTGPLGYSCPLDPSYFHVLPHDVFLEITDEEGNSKPDGELGFITVTGGRNPYLPLVRYQTGDLGSMQSKPCACGERTPRFLLSDMRKPVFFLSVKQEKINPIDISRILREYPIYRHRLTQISNLELFLEIQPMPSFQPLEEIQLQKRIAALFGSGIKIRIEVVDFGESKIIPYVNEYETL